MNNKPQSHQGKTKSHDKKPKHVNQKYHTNPKNQS